MQGVCRSSFVLVLALFVLPRPAHAWVETRLIADELRVTVARSGMALVEHAVTMRVQGGPLRSFDLPLSDTNVVPEPMGSATASEGDGVPLALQVTSRPDGSLRVNIESARGIAHGLYLFRIRYRKNLLSGDGLRRDGAVVRLGIVGPAWSEGLDNARCTFVLPPAPIEPRVSDERRTDTTSEAGFGFISEVKRYPDRDEVELVRPHVARREAVVWSTRIDARALADAADSRLRPPLAPPVSQVGQVGPAMRIAYGLAALIIAVGFSALVALKWKHAERRAAGVATLRALLPIPPVLRIVLAGPALTMGMALQLVGEAPWWGVAVVLLAMSTSWYRRPTWLRAPRGPGRWLALSDSDAFEVRAPSADDWLDASTRRGAFTFAMTLVLITAIAALGSALDPQVTYALLFDAAVIFPVFGTARMRDLPPHPMASAGPTLARIAKRLRDDQTLRAIAWARLPQGSDTFDELRLLCSPRVPLRGFSALEVGLVTWTGMGGPASCPEILIRVVEGSPCHDALVKVLRGALFVRGRKPDERVVTVRPRLPSAAMTAALTARLLRCAAEDRPAYAVTPAKAGNAAMRSAGRPERTANDGTVASPFQAM